MPSTNHKPRRNRTRSARRMWDELLIANSPHCFDVNQKTQYCANLVVEYVDELMSLRRKRWQR